MDLEAFKESLNDAEPTRLPIALRALWHEGRNNWKKAHDLLQDQEDGAGAWVHAYLHRKEGDLTNAAYWYRKAGKPVASGSLSAEWHAIAEALLTGG